MNENSLEILHKIDFRFVESTQEYSNLQKQTKIEDRKTCTTSGTFTYSFG